MTLTEFAGTYQRTIADRVSKAAGAKEYLKEEDLIPKIKDIQNQFKKLNEDLDLGLKLPDDSK